MACFGPRDDIALQILHLVEDLALHSRVRKYRRHTHEQLVAYLKLDSGAQATQLKLNSIQPASMALLSCSPQSAMARAVPHRSCQAHIP